MTDIKTQFTDAMSKKVSGGVTSQSGAELSGIPGNPTLSSINGSPIGSFDPVSVSRIPKSEQLPTQFETSIKKTGI